MPTYYVRPDGDDANSGTGPEAENAWATPAKAFSTPSAGDTVILAPGTYRTSTGWTVTAAGSGSNYITYAGDPWALSFADVDPGPVRLTGCDSSETPSCAAHVITANRDALRFYNLVIDGTAAGSYHGIDFVSAVNNRRVFACIVQATHTAISKAVEATDCLLVGGMYGVANAYRVERTVALGGSAGIYRASLASNAIALGGTYGCYNVEAVEHCLAHAYEGFRGCTSYGAIATGCALGFRGGKAYHSLAIACATGYYGDMTANSCKYLACGADSSGTINTDEGYEGLAAASHTGWLDYGRLILLRQALEYDMHMEADLSIESTLSTDILGRARPLRAESGRTPGPWEHSWATADWATGTGPPAIVLPRKGVKDFYVPGRRGDTITATAQVTFTGTGDKPQLVVSGDGTTQQTATATGDGSGEELSVSATLDRDCILTVRCYARDSAADATATFADLEVSAG